MRLELVIPFLKSNFNRLSSGEIFHQRELDELGVQHTGLITHPENQGVAFERIILGEPMPDTHRMFLIKMLKRVLGTLLLTPTVSLEV